MTLSRVAMVGAVVAGVFAGAPLAGAQPLPTPGPELPQIPSLPLPVPAVPATSSPATSTPVVSATPAAQATTTPAAQATTTPAAQATTTPAVPPTSTPATTTPAATSVAAAPAACKPWTVSTVASGFGTLENLGFDGRGKMLLSESTVLGDGAIRTLTPGGDKGTLVSSVNSPGGIVVDGGRVLFNTGDNVMAGLYGSTNGTVESVDLDGGKRSTLAHGLTMPNGLAKLENGDLLVTNVLGGKPGIVRIPATDPHEPVTVRTDIGSANGIFASPDGKTVYVGNTLEETTQIRVLDAKDLTGPVRVLSLPGAGPANAGDDLTVGADGNLYEALNGAGKVVRVDPASGDTCEIATGLPLTSSVRFGAGPGWDATALYATSFEGTVHKLVPPAN
ncbi:SMP-30/gluconolactonase/LRE family protein [Rhodococcus sp. NPDC127528]|uniref:SMP-30/gluconolactonase/LRE family protein n=1 Tax=unclassified Rhodococcus (in: high G+C Gram-positive bacteria) TaxID=192944 RepID=UPI003629B784